MKVSNKKIYILGVAVLLLVLIIILPLLYLIRKSSQELVAQKKELVSFQQKEKSFKDLQEKYEFYQKDLEKIDSLFVDPALPIEFIKFLEKSALNSQASIKVSLTEEVKEPEPAISFSISFSGFFSNLFKFIDKLENGPYLIEIVNFNVKKLAPEPSGNIMANLELMVLTK